MESNVPVRRCGVLRMKKIRANGEVLDLGIMSFYHKNPIINFFGNVWVRINSVLNRKKRLS